jgi:sensor histidine kinase YesM
MYDIELQIKPSDWLYVLLTGIIFATLLSTLGYLLWEHAWIEGALFGALLGFSITLFSLLFITLMNQKILPNVDKSYWLPFAVFFSFLSGFIGTLLSTAMAEYLSIELITLFHSDPVKVALAIGVLTYIVGALLYRFVRMRNEKEMVDQHYLKSRLRSLETQLNPHFLFNALNSIAELIHHDPQKAEVAVLKVSTFLRNTMDEKALIPIEEELKNVKDYVELENIRFSGRIKLHLPDTVPSIDIPKFSLQLLVENAIKHGLIPKKALHITIEYHHGDHSLSVQNNGKAMSGERFGIGLKNLAQRLQLLCHGTIEVIDTQKPTFKIHLGGCHEDSDR